MNSPRYPPAGLLLRFSGHQIVFDGGPGAEPPDGVAAWLVTDERAELRTALRRLAAARGLTPRIGHYTGDSVRVEPHPVEHTSHPTVGYAISAGRTTVVWAPEFWRFPSWAAGADLLFADAAGWNRPIRFRGGVGGHASVRDVAANAVRLRVRRVVYAHIGRPCLRAIDAGLDPPYGEWGVTGRSYDV
ncbi:hypothetical protein E1262_14295 [Jiangella aurantiaca]|uniref:Metallo-beta-lactamase domain-containing protein n=2 Tax=Jiangella aurantiaca TaxID=2530373 RepID=A0A4R5ACL6_9ACTN|nr:hypothetical protein E1262_14295 [Jiangella aurantiaca]